MIILIFLTSCTEVQTMNLTPEYENLDYVPDTNITQIVEQQTEEIIQAEPSEEKETPLTIQDESLVYINPENIVKKMCPEQVLLGLRSCKIVKNGDINITIKNAGYTNLTMVFYLYYEDELMGYSYQDEPFYTKEEKTFTLDFDSLENQYGEITKIEATPVLLQGLEAMSCLNKKLPVIIKSGCR
ncbi:MAG: hypothetical protein KKE20_03470 [Nanoarchaeota archaeon]|nr:hypothetical protein [Nanoarchaeota archaeon]